MICRHCHTGTVTRPRGLCWKCYYTPGLREFYPSTSKFAHRGVGNFTGVQPLPTPTLAPAGTRAKVEVMARRAELGEQLFHPADAGGDDGSQKATEICTALCIAAATDVPTAEQSAAESTAAVLAGAIEAIFRRAADLAAAG